MTSRGSTALFGPKMSILIQKRHPYTGNLNSETSGDSKNAFLHCGDVSAPVLTTKIKRNMWQPSWHSSTTDAASGGVRNSRGASMLLPDPPLAALAVQLLTQASRLLSTCPDESVNAAMAPAGTLLLVDVKPACFAAVFTVTSWHYSALLLMRQYVTDS